MGLRYTRGSGMPQVTDALAGWTQEIVLVRVSQLVEDGLVKQCETRIKFNGTVQPLSPRQIMLKPEGQRSWTWLQVHCYSTTVNLNDNDIVLYRGQNFKVMGVNDYRLNGFIEYHLVKDYAR